MTTVKSSFSFKRFWPAYKNLLRRNRGTAMFYGVLGFIFLGAQYVITLLNYTKYGEGYYDRFEVIGPAGVYNGFAVVFFTMMSLIVPIIVATNLFGYMHNKRSVDVYHAMPLTRSELYLTTSAAGITLIWVPLILNFAFVSVCAVFAPQRNFGMIALELLCWMAVSFVLFAITAFAAVNVGTTFDTAIFSLGLNASIALPYLVVIAISSVFLYGFSAVDSEYLFTATRLSPIALMVVRQALGDNAPENYLPENNLTILLWLIAGVGIFMGGLFVYKKRKSEQAESVGDLAPLQMFLRAVGTLVGGTAMGALFCAVLGVDSSEPVYLASTMVGSLIIYFIGDVLLTRTVRSIPKALPAALATTAAVCLMVGGIIYGGFGFERRVPAQQNVAYVTLDNYYSRYTNEPSFNENYNRSYVIKDAEAIRLILEIHQAQLDAHFGSGEEILPYTNSGRMQMTYTLKDGRTLARSYNELYPSTYSALIALECTPELVQQVHSVFKATPEILDSISVTNALGNQTQELKLDTAQKQQLLEAVRQDLLAQTPETFKNSAQALGYLQLNYKYPDFRRNKQRTAAYAAEGAVESSVEYAMATGEVMITENFTNTHALLVAFGAAKQLENDFSTVKQAFLGGADFRYFYGSSIMRPTSTEELYYVQDVFFDKYYKDQNNSKPYVTLDNQQLMSLKKDLTSIHISSVKSPYLIVAIASEEDDDIPVTGYYFVAFNALPEELKAEVIASMQLQYDDDQLREMGYLD